MELEKDWVQYPVVRLDMSVTNATAEGLKSRFNSMFRDLEEKHSIKTYTDDGLGTRFERIIKTLYEQTSKPVVVLVDEYDSLLQHSWHTPDYEPCTSIYREVFAVLKAATQYEKFVFITGITKFTQISLFSVLNNLNNISFFPEYAAVCGITVQETIDNFNPEI